MKENSSSGKNARLSEIVEASFKENEKLQIKDPIMELNFHMFFTEAAQWADELPESVKSDERSFKNELMLFIDKTENELREIERKNNCNHSVILVVLTSIFLIKGANWARNNPPKEHQ